MLKHGGSGLVCVRCGRELDLPKGEDLAAAAAAGWHLKKIPGGLDMCPECVEHQGVLDEHKPTVDGWELIGTIAQWRSADGKEGALVGACCSLPLCGCRIVGNGTLPHPLEIKFCKMHSAMGAREFPAEYIAYELPFNATCGCGATMTVNPGYDVVQAAKEMGWTLQVLKTDGTGTGTCKECQDGE